jgi:hypothetical protein
MTAQGSTLIKIGASPVATNQVQLNPIPATTATVLRLTMNGQPPR